MQLQLVRQQLGEQLPIVDRVTAPIQLHVGELELTYVLVLESLVASVLLGVHFLHENALVLDFSTGPGKVFHANAGSIPQPALEQLVPVYEASNKVHTKVCTVAATEVTPSHVVNGVQFLCSGEYRACTFPTVRILSSGL